MAITKTVNVKIPSAGILQYEGGIDANLEQIKQDLGHIFDNMFDYILGEIEKAIDEDLLNNSLASAFNITEQTELDLQSEEETRFQEETFTHWIGYNDIGLSYIAKKYGTTVEKLMKLNNLTTTNIKIKDTLQIPLSTLPAGVALPTAPVARTTLIKGDDYEVKPGEGLFEIAQREKKNLKDLIKWNKLDHRSPDLYIGDKLYFHDPNEIQVNKEENNVDFGKIQYKYKFLEEIDKSNASQEWKEFIKYVVESGGYDEIVEELYKKKMAPYLIENGINIGLYGREYYDGPVKVPEAIKKRLRGEAEQETLPYLKHIWAVEKSGFDPGSSFIDAINPLVHVGYTSTLALTVSNKKEGQAMLSNIGLDIILSWFGSGTLKKLTELRNIKNISTIKNVAKTGTPPGTSVNTSGKLQNKNSNFARESQRQGEKTFVDDAFDEAGKLKKNAKYKTGEFGYLGETDDLGRLSTFEIDDLQLTQRGKRLKHDPNTPGKLKDDHAGHMIADRFGGSPELDNLVSQASKVNQGKFATLENQWANAIKNGQKVEVKIKINYEGDALRPSSFDIEYRIDGKLFFEPIKNN